MSFVCTPAVFGCCWAEGAEQSFLWPLVLKSSAPCTPERADFSKSFKQLPAGNSKKLSSRSSNARGSVLILLGTGNWIPAKFTPPVPTPGTRPCTTPRRSTSTEWYGRGDDVLSARGGNLPGVGCLLRERDPQVTACGTGRPQGQHP